MDELRLITAVAAHCSLYDPTNNKYKDVELRNALWQKIADDLHMEVEACKAKWRTLRDGFTRALRQQREARNGLLCKVKKPWRYQTEMEFLIPFISSRESRASTADQGAEADDQDFPAKGSSPRDDCEADPLRDNDDTNSTSSNSGPEPPLLLPVAFPPHSPSDLKRQLDHGESASREALDYGLKRQLDQGESASREALDYGLKRQLDQGESAQALDYLLCRGQEVDTVPIKERKLDSPKSAHYQCRYLSDDPTEAFFFSMGQSVKRLPFYLQAQVKMKVCQLVTEAEMECLDSVSNQ